MTTVPQSRPTRRFLRPSWPMIIAGVLVVALIATFAIRMLTTTAADPLQGGTQATVTRGNLVLGIQATGKVEPRTESQLAFANPSGRVSEVLVSEGDLVTAQQALIQLDVRGLKAEVLASEAALTQAKADLAAVHDRATPPEIAANKAQVAAAAGALRQTEGTVTPADIRAAEASVSEAQAHLAKLEAGADTVDVTRARNTLATARADLDRQRVSLAAAKEQATRLVEQRANAVRDAQSAYSTAYWDLEYVKKNETDPRTGRSLNDAQKQDFAVAFDSANLNLANAESALAQAQVDLATANQNEATGLATTQAQVSTAQASLDDLLKGTDADLLAAARAQLARAQADLTRLTGAARQGALDAQRGNLAAAQARLDQLLADPKASDLARAEARVAQAAAQLEQVKIRLEDATLRAPFAGVVTTLNVAPGESVGQQSPLTLIDTSRFKIEVTVDEVDVARVSIGQDVTVLIDALGAPTLNGKIQGIETKPQSNTGVTAYLVTIEMTPDKRPLKIGMTASATIVADKRDAVLSLPVPAVRNENGQNVVSIITAGPDGRPTVTSHVVETGLRTSDQIEILSGLEAGQKVLIAGTAK